MTAQSDAFEELNTRIEKLRQVAGVNVQHDAKVPDPDDPNEERQINILIQNNGRRTGVECRDRAGSQSVMWVEELIGRKQCLQLDAIIGVAVSGFSKLAQTKAKRYGIALYDYRTLTDTEIASWAGAAHVEAVFVQFDPLCIVAGVPASAEQQLPQHVTLQFKKTDGYAAIIILSETMLSPTKESSVFDRLTPMALILTEFQSGYYRSDTPAALSRSQRTVRRFRLLAILRRRPLFARCRFSDSTTPSSR